MQVLRPPETKGRMEVDCGGEVLTTKGQDRVDESKDETHSENQGSGALDTNYGGRLIENSHLERFMNRTRHRQYEIAFDCPEFTCLCPRSGFPDFALIKIRYIPDEWCVELKSLKLYINSFRNQRVFHEDVTNRIADDLVELLNPWQIEVLGDFNVRGNIKTVITSKHSRQAEKVLPNY